MMADEILEEEVIDPNDVVLKGYSGTDTRYENVPKVWLTSADGESKVPFSYGEAVDNVPVELDFSEGDQVVIAPDGTLVRSAIIAQPENLVPENIKIGEIVAGIPGKFVGEGEAVSIELDLSRGNQVVLPVSDGKLLSQVTIIKPETLVEENIAKDVVIAGVMGSFQGGGDVENMPQLYAPTALSALATASDGRKYFTVTNPYTKNGMFPRKLQILQNASDGTTIVVAEIALSTTSYTNTVSVYATDYNQALPIHQPQARFAADGFANSDAFMNSSVIFTVSALAYILENVTLSTQRALAFYGDVLKFTLTPGSGYYLPKTASVVGGATYTYDPDNKSLTLTVNGSGDITVTVAAVNMPWLHDPIITSFSYPTIKATCPKNSEIMVLSLNGTKLGEYESFFPPSATWDVSAISGATYGFALSSGYYVSQNKGASGSYAICRLNFNVIGGSVTVQLACINYAESNFDFGIISTVDATLARSSTADSSNVLKSFKGSSMSSVQYVSFTVSEGSHFVEIKYRKDSSGNQNNDNFQFKVNSITANITATEFSIDLSEYEDLLNYGDSNFSLVAKADGYTDSDPVAVTRTISLAITSDLNILSVTGFVPSMVQAFELHIDDALVDTLDYDSASEWSADLSLYSEEDVPILHTVYLRAIGDGVAENQSNVIESYLKWYTISYYDDDGTLLHSEQMEYNGVPTYTPSKSGFVFIGWDTEVAPVTGDTSYTAQWVEKIAFADASWEYISQMSEMGYASKVFAVGDTKTVTYSTSTSIILAIADFGVDDLSDGSGKAGITIVALNSVPVTVTPFSTSGYGYNSINTTLKGTVLPNLPSDFRAVIKSVNKSYDKASASNSTNLTTEALKLWAPSITELNIDRSTIVSSSYVDRIANLGSAYTLFKGTSVTIRTPGGTSGYVEFWTRSTYKMGYSCPVSAYISGATKKATFRNSTSYTYNLLFACCV